MEATAAQQIADRRNLPPRTAREFGRAKRYRRLTAGLECSAFEKCCLLTDQQSEHESGDGRNQAGAQSNDILCGPAEMMLWQSGAKKHTNKRPAEDASKRRYGHQQGTDSSFLQPHVEITLALPALSFNIKARRIGRAMQRCIRFRGQPATGLIPSPRQQTLQRGNLRIHRIGSTPTGADSSADEQPAGIAAEENRSCADRSGTNERARRMQRAKISSQRNFVLQCAFGCR